MQRAPLSVRLQEVVGLLFIAFVESALFVSYLVWYPPTPVAIIGWPFGVSLHYLFWPVAFIGTAAAAAVASSWPLGSAEVEDVNPPEPKGFVMWLKSLGYEWQPNLHRRSFTAPVGSWVKKLSVIALTLLLISASVAFAGVRPAVAVTTVKLASLPNCTTEAGLFWDSVNSVAWQPCYDTGILYKEDFSTSPATLSAYDIHSTMGTFNEIAVLVDSSNIYNIGRGGGGSFAGVAQSSLSNPTSLTTPVVGLTGDVLYPVEASGHLYIPYNGGVRDYTIGGSSTAVSTGQQMIQCASDGSGNILCTSLSGSLWEITNDVATERVTGLSSPYGVAAGSGFAYVAQHGTNKVVKVSETTWGIVATSSLPSGARPYGVAIYGSFIATDSDGSDQTARNVYILNAADLTTANTVTCPVIESGVCRPLFILITDPSGNVYVGFQGSAGAAQISNPFTSTSTTTTTTSTSSSSSTTTTSSSSTTTTTAQTVPPGTSGAQYSPFITFTSGNLYSAQRNGNFTVSGFLWFRTGGYVGTFGNLTYFDPPYWTADPAKTNFWNQGMAAFVCQFVTHYLPFCKEVTAPKYLADPSPVRTGLFCEDTAAAVSSWRDCPGGVWFPITYESFTVSVTLKGQPDCQTQNPCPFTFEAYGTVAPPSGLPYSAENIFVYQRG